uniref:hypothetical protein n=1 Tax=uncultured Dysgonomonas sp. TaxID=206096 RepID=UPI002629EBFC|nr:hypothetical protein [uncultured Dysgonomonas sp.]
MKTLLIAISTTILLLFTSCEDDMDKGVGAGGGMQDANTITRSTLPQEDNGIIPITDTILKVDENLDKQ